MPVDGAGAVEFPAGIMGAEVSMRRDQIMSRDPELMSGALVFAGTRVPVEILIQYLTAGDSLAAFLDDFPTVTHDQAIGLLELMLRNVEAETAVAAAS